MKTIALVSGNALAAALAVIAPSVSAQATQDSPQAAAQPSPAPPPPTSTEPAAGPASAGSDIIVTGTRTQGLRVADSPAPIQLLGNDTFKRVGQPDLNSVLAQQLPSIQVQAYGTDQTALHPSIKLRGLSPNHTLIEVNGKRRHGTSNVNVTAGPYSGGAAPDLSLIPQDAIDHIEVLQDGAAAQYGTDAIAGVVNLILKNRPGFNLDATGGHYIDQGGSRYDVQARVGAEVLDNLTINIVGEHSFKDYSFRGAADPRVSNTSIASVAALLNAYPAIRQFPNYPAVNRQPGDAQIELTNGLYNASWKPSADFEVYSFGTFSHKIGRSNQNYRLPNVVVGKSTVGAPAGQGDVYAPGGFTPQQLTREDDYAVTGGIRGTLLDTTFDLSSTYGKDTNNIFVDRSANAALYFDTSTTTTRGYTPTQFYDGSFLFSQWSNTLDLAHKFDLGLANPLNVAAGLEYRRENYTLRAGDPSSYYISPYATTVVNGVNVAAKQGGAQSFFGYSPPNASDNTRRVWAEYLDLNLKPVDAWVIDGAVRHENYSDFGDTTVLKLTSRYDFSPAFAIRGTASTGFRAPTLAEAFYSGINTGPTSLTGIFAPNSAGARLLGLNGLKPEKSTNFSAGFVAHPAPRLSITLDGYYIQIRDRIVQSGTFYGANYVRGTPVPGTPISPAVLDALRAVGVPVDSVLGTLQAGATNGQSGTIALLTFVNGVTTRTVGADFQANYSSDFDSLGHIDWSLSANYNDTRIQRIASPPSGVNQATLLLDPLAQSTLTDQTPKFRATAGAYWTWRSFFINLRESFYSSSSALAPDPTTGLFVDRLTDKSHFITDLEAGVNLTRGVRLSGGANNLFNVYPTRYPDSYRNQFYSGNSVGYITQYPTWSPIGINGGYYYGRLSISF